MEEKLNEYNIHFEVFDLDKISSKSIINNVTSDLPIMIIESLKMSVKPCSCKGMTTVKIFAKENRFDVMTSYCCLDFERIASIFFPK